MTEFDTESKKNKLSRRDFIKLAGLGAAGIAFSKLAKSEHPANPERESLRNRVTIETDRAIFVPFYEERHDRPITLDEIKEVPNIDLFFYEVTSPSFAEEGVAPFKIMYATKIIEVSVAEVKMGIQPQKIRVMSDETLAHFSTNDIYMSYEAKALPQEFSNKVESIRLARDSIGVGSLLLVLAHAIKLASGENLNPKEIPQTIIPLLTSAWTLQPMETLIYRMLPEGVSRTHYKDTLFRTFQRFENLMTQIHPEEVGVFLRNILMARKLQAISEILPTYRRLESKPLIAFNTHSGHGGIEDFLTLGDNFTLAALNIYPDSTIRGLLKFNGPPGATLEKQIETFCTNYIYPVRKILKENEPVRYSFVDQKLRGYLKQRLLGSQNT